MRKKAGRLLILTVTLFMITSFVIPFFAFASENGKEVGNNKSLKDYDNAKIGIMTGTIFDTMAKDTFKNPELFFFNTNADMIEALNANKIDAFIADEPVFRIMKMQNKDLTIVDEHISDDDYGFFFSKNKSNKKICDELSAFITELKESEELYKIINKWYSENAELDVSPESLTDTNGTLVYALDSQFPPFSFLKSGKPTGYDLDIITRFCKKYGYALKCEEINSDAMIPSVVSGKTTIGGSGISITEERKESVYFTEPYYSGGTVLVIKNNTTSSNAEFNSIAELKGKTFAIKTGSIFDKIINETECLSENEKIEYFQNEQDEITALLNKKVDAVILDLPVGKLAVSLNEGITILDEHFVEDLYGFGLKKNSELTEPFNDTLKTLKQNGKLEELYAKWFDKDESKKVLTQQNTDGKNGTLKFWTNATVAPMSYIGENGEPIGLEIDIILHIAEILNYKVEIINSDFSSLIPAVTTGKADVISGCISITEERKQSIDFSDPYYNGAIVALIRTLNTVENESGFFENIKDSFSKTFIKDSRWKLFTEGISITMLITLLSIIFGTILGFCIFMTCKNGNTLANKITDIFVAVLQKTPGVVFLMIMYYVVFGKSEISGTFVSVIAFTLTFASSVIGMLRMGVGAVDKGQTEASLALGYTNNKTFFKIILPQASAHFMPTFKSEIVSLLKATSIVGYVAVEDLTKMSDIVRSRTYEAFFPLIATAIIYFILAQLLTTVVQFVIKRTDPKRRTTKKILKGVNEK